MSQPSSKISPLGNYREAPNKAYISTRPFDSTSNPTGTLYSYATSFNTNYQTVGSLTLNTNATAANCPARRLLHLNGKMLIPGVNPGGGAGVNPTTGTGSSTPATLPFPMVGVYDPVSGLNGFINPQDTTWGVYDATLGATYDLGLANPDSTLAGNGNDNDTSTTTAALFTAQVTSGSPTLTVIAMTNGGTIRLGMTVVQATNVVSAQTIIAQTSGTPGGIGVYTLSANADAGSGSTVKTVAYNHGLNTTAGALTTYVGTAVVVGAGTTATVYSSVLKSDAIVFITDAGYDSGATANLTSKALVDASVSPPTLTITTTAPGAGSYRFVNYLIYN